MYIYYTWLIIAALILTNSLFVVTEIAIVAAQKSKLEILKAKGKKSAELALKLKALPEFFLSTVQVAITLLSIIIGMFAGQELSDDFITMFTDIGLSERAAYFAASGITLLIVTYLTALCEIVPKRIALLYPEQIAIYLSPFMKYTGMILFPIVKLLDLSTQLIMRLFRLHKVKGQHLHVSLDEIRFIIRQAKVEGIVADTEHDIIRRIINLRNMHVGAIMTPRHKLVVVDIHDSKDTILAKLKGVVFNYFPLVDGDLSNIQGVMSIKNYLSNCANGIDQPDRDLVNYIYIPDLAKVGNLIEIMRDQKAAVAIVVDEYGSIEGIVTISDIFKVLMHDLASLSEGQGSKVIKLPKNAGYLIDGNISIDEITELLEIHEIPGSEEEDYRTLASFILKQLGRIAKVGDMVKLDSWNLKVMRMEHFRIAQVKITKINN